LHRIEYWDSIKNFIHENGSISNQEARNIIWIYDTLKMTRILQELVKNKLLVSEWNKRFTRYKFPDNAFIIRNSIFKGDENRKK
jgi:predicted HTH transcriptional regulator